MILYQNAIWASFSDWQIRVWETLVENTKPMTLSGNSSTVCWMLEIDDDTIWSCGGHLVIKVTRFLTWEHIVPNWKYLIVVVKLFCFQWDSQRRETIKTIEVKNVDLKVMAKVNELVWVGEYQHLKFSPTLHPQGNEWMNANISSPLN